MSIDPGHERPQGVPPRPAQPQERGESYEVRDDGPSPGPAAGPVGAAVWHVAVPGGAAEGPLTLDALRQRMSAARLGPQTLVWRPGMPAWLPAREVSELRSAPAGDALPPPLALPPVGGPSKPLLAMPAELEKLLTSPRLFRMVGRGCGVLGVLLLPVSFLEAALTWGTRGGPAFTDALLLILAFFAGEATGTVLEKLGNKDARWSQEDPAKPPR